MKWSGESKPRAKESKTSVKKPKAVSPATAQPITIASFPAKMAAAIERKRRREKLSRTDYFIRLALKDLLNHDRNQPQPPSKAPRKAAGENG